MKKYYSSYEEYKEIQSPKDARQGSQPELDLEGLVDPGTSVNTNRRDFLKLMGFTLGYAALATGCENPVRKAIPFLNQPMEVIPGIANFYASTFFDGDDYCSILVKTREGRPIKIEGNAMSSLTRGGTSARVQASVLNLYDMARLRNPLKGKEETNWDTADNEIIEKLQQISEQGSKIVVLTSTIISPSTRQIIRDFLVRYPTAKWITYDTIPASGILEANELSFGQRVIPDYRFDKAKLIVAFNADFLGNWISPVEYTKRYASGRQLLHGEHTMSKHIQYESYLSLTGSNADYRVQIKPSEEGTVLLNLYNAIAAGRGAARFSASSSPVPVDSLAEQLLAHQGTSLVVSGSNDPCLQVIVNAINYLLGNIGSTVDFARPLLLKQGLDKEMSTVVDEMNQGLVGALITCQVNPAYDYPDAARFISGVEKTILSVSLSERLDETSRLMQYVCPDNHYLESWNDAEPAKGYFSLGQPTIPKLFNTRQAQESLLKWIGSDKDYYTCIREYWQNHLFPLQSAKALFTDFWNQCVHDGVFELPEEPISLTYQERDLRIPDMGPVEGFELVLYQKLGLGSGRYSNNPWLQELPDPITRATWDNYLCVSPSDAERLGIESEDVILLNGESEIPVIVQPGQPSGTVSLALGYGRTGAGKVANGLGINGYPFIVLQNGNRHFYTGNIRIEKTGKTYPLARTQTHHTMEGRAIVRETTLEEWHSDPKSGNEMHMDIVRQNLTLYEIPVFDGIHWGMAINLNACIGCGNCVISCQAENNVPVIGKEQIRMRRTMHWMRIDRYYSEEADNPEVVHMPVMCQHCDNAPCENVCPVAATPHSSEGLNQMAYNRCIGTRYCLNNCPYRVRRFNWFEFSNNEEFDYHMNNDLGKMVLNPDVTVRSRGVVEKCSFCVQRLQEKKLQAKKENRILADGEVKTACQESCPADAIAFGDMNDSDSMVSKLMVDPRTYQLLEQIHTLPSVHYMTKVRNMQPEDKQRTYRITYPIIGEGEHLESAKGHEGE